MKRLFLYLGGALLLLTALFFNYSSTPTCTQTTSTITIDVPMRDGTFLPTDIYFPEGKNKNLPSILIRNPTGRKTYHQVFTPLTQAGYLVAIQDTRNVVDPEGKTLPLIHDGWGENQDGYDAVEWLAANPMSNGKIGTLGFSIMGITQLLMAPTNPPHLCCQYIGVAAADMFNHAAFHGGCYRKHQVENWVSYHSPHPDNLAYVMKQTPGSAFWENLDSIAVADQVNVPGFFYTGWYDVFLEGTIDGFNARQKDGGPRAKGEQKLIIGPWTHYWPHRLTLGEFEIPEPGKWPPLDVSPKIWFDHHLKGEKNAIDDLAPITYYVMGPFDGTPSKGNRWKSADKWPVDAKETPLYLSAEGTLSFSPIAEAEELLYHYNPKDPVPTIGGNNLFLEAGPKDQSSIESRDDVLLFTSSPLTEDLEVTGALKAIVYFESNPPNTDVAVRLTDVYPDGKSILIADGIVSTRMSQTSEHTVSLESISTVFAKGHKIRVSISSSNYPRFENSLYSSSPEDTELPLSTDNILFLGGEHPSRIILPVVE